MPELRMVPDALIWQDMDGDTELIKRLNSLLTVNLIWRHDVPSDECLFEAKALIAFADGSDLRDRILTCLSIRFRHQSEDSDLVRQVLALLRDWNQTTGGGDDEATPV